MHMLVFLLVCFAAGAVLALIMPILGVIMSGILAILGVR